MMMLFLLSQEISSKNRSLVKEVAKLNDDLKQARKDRHEQTIQLRSKRVERQQDGLKHIKLVQKNKRLNKKLTDAECQLEKTENEREELR